MVTPKIHNHNHNYDTRSKRNCYLCSSTQGCIAAKEPDIQNQDHLTCLSTNGSPIRLVGRRQGVRNKTLVACARSSVFPDDLVFTILLLIPAKLLHENMRLVSRVWRQTITSPLFITNHLQISSSAHTHGLIVDHPEQQNHGAFYIKPPISYTNPEFQVTELAKPPHTRIKGSYHGLVLLHDEVNPNIKRLIQRPTPPQVWVYTVGVDIKWRRLKLQGGIDKISGTCSRIPFHTPRSVGGFVYWSSHNFPYGCALDVDTETFCRFSMFPRPNTMPQIFDPQYRIICLQTGLGLVISCKLEFGGCYVLWELYELTDLKSSKWTKIIDIDFSSIRSQVEKYYQTTEYRAVKPLVYTNDEKLWVFGGYSSSLDVFYYHPREENIVPVPVKRNDGQSFISVYHHVNTLLHC